MIDQANIFITLLKQSSLLKKAEDTEVDTAEQSAIKLRSQQQTSNALVVTDQRPTNGSLPVQQLNLVQMPSQNVVCFVVKSFFNSYYWEYKPSVITVLYGYVGS